MKRVYLHSKTDCMKKWWDKEGKKVRVLAPMVGMVWTDKRTF